MFCYNVKNLNETASFLPKRDSVTGREILKVLGPLLYNRVFLLSTANLYLESNEFGK